MKEAFEKLKERLEAEIKDFISCIPDGDYLRGNVNFSVAARNIVSEVEAECLKNPVYQYAMVYAKNLVQFGVDVRDKLDSAVAQSIALNRAYIKGVDDERKRMYEAEFGKDINALGNGWIPCSERLPENMQQCLTTAKIYFVPDHVDEPDNYIGVELNTYSENFGWLMNPNVIAWMPLPSPFKPEKGE